MEKLVQCKQKLLAGFSEMEMGGMYELAHELFMDVYFTASAHEFEYKMETKMYAIFGLALACLGLDNIVGARKYTNEMKEYNEMEYTILREVVNASNGKDRIQYFSRDTIQYIM